MNPNDAHLFWNDSDGTLQGVTVATRPLTIGTHAMEVAGSAPGVERVESELVVQAPSQASGAATD